MNKEKGTSYELFILDHLIQTEKYDSAWLWKDIPEKILCEENIITNYANYSLVRNDIGIDILAKKNNEYVYIQCKNYTNSICIIDLAGYFFFKSAYNKKCKVYYNGNLSNRINIIHPNNEEFINIPFNNKNIITQIINNNQIYEVRDYQQEALHLLNDKKRAIINIPCGMGKTYLSCLMATKYDNIVFFAPTKELCMQTFNIYQHYFKNHCCNLVSSDGVRNIENINIKKKNIFISTFKSCDIINTFIEKLKNPFVIIDEFHNLSNNDIFNKKNELYKILHSEYRILFLSATPRYLDCNNIFGTNIYKYNWNDAIKNKYINDFEIILPTSDYTSIEINDFIKLFDIDNINQFNYKYIRKIYFILRSILFNGNKKCIIYLPTTKKAKECENIIGWMSRLFNRIINTYTVNFETSKKNRKIVIDNFIKNNDINILLNVHVLDEGINIPECDSVFITNPSDNIENIIQRMSRCNRIYNGKNKSSIYLWCNEKKIKKIMDYINNNTGNELINKFNRIDFGLNKLVGGNKDRQLENIQDGQIEVNHIQNQKAIGSTKTVRTCPNCNKEFDRKSSYLDHIDPNRKFPCTKVVQYGGEQNEMNDLKEKLIEQNEMNDLKEKLIEQLKESHKREIEYYKKDNEYLKDQLEKKKNKNSVNITNNNNTVYMVNYIMDDHAESPLIEMKNDYMNILDRILSKSIKK